MNHHRCIYSAILKKQSVEMLYLDNEDEADFRWDDEGTWGVDRGAVSVNKFLGSILIVSSVDSTCSTDLDICIGMPSFRNIFMRTRCILSKFKPSGFGGSEGWGYDYHVGYLELGFLTANFSGSTITRTVVPSLHPNNWHAS